MWFEVTSHEFYTRGSRRSPPSCHDYPKQCEVLQGLIYAESYRCHAGGTGPVSELRYLQWRAFLVLFKTANIFKRLRC